MKEALFKASFFIKIIFILKAFFTCRVRTGKKAFHLIFTPFPTLPQGGRRPIIKASSNTFVLCGL
jgi:hypothetical protein